MQAGWLAVLAAIGGSFGASEVRSPVHAELEDAAFEDRLEPLAHELAHTREPEFELAFGASPVQRGFALELRGGEAFGWALVSFESEHARPTRELVRLDGRGNARVIERNWRAPSPVRATCQMRRSSLARARLALTIPSAASFPQAPGFVLTSGALVITEIMKDPTTVSDAMGEWFEVRNVSSQAIDLTGWLLTDGTGNNHLIQSASGPVIVPSRSYFVLGNNANIATNGGVPVDYKYSSFQLANAADSIQILDSQGLFVDVVLYDDGIYWPDTPGKSLSLDRALVDVVSNDDGDNWCVGIMNISPSNADCATPRRANTVCP
ncbi:MAG: lamin tail domain-containing protein [Planctomycetes bacterium]|nr:lamin tail domain-containing protein [Planctomycetota bacterium]